MADPFSLNELPLGVFTLSAFDCKINLSDMARKVAAFGEFLNQAVGSHIKAVVVARAQELGVSTDSLLEHAAADGMFIIEWTYNYDSPGPIYHAVRQPVISIWSKSGSQPSVAGVQFPPHVRGRPMSCPASRTTLATVA